MGFLRGVIGVCESEFLVVALNEGNRDMFSGGGLIALSVFLVLWSVVAPLGTLVQQS